MAARKHHVTLGVSAEALEKLLRLDGSMHIVDARLNDEHGYRMVEFTIEAPAAPGDAVEMMPVYHHNGRPDPVILREVRWRHRDGRESVQSIAFPTGKEAA